MKGRTTGCQMQKFPTFSLYTTSAGRGLQHFQPAISWREVAIELWVQKQGRISEQLYSLGVLRNAADLAWCSLEVQQRLRWMLKGDAAKHCRIEMYQRPRVVEQA